MGTEVLRPQDFWTDRFRLYPPPFHRRKIRNEFSNSRPRRKPSLPRLERPEQRRKSPSPSPPPSPLPKPGPARPEQRRKSPSPPPLPPPPSPSSQQPQFQKPEPLLPQTPRRSSSAHELQTHFNQIGDPPQMGQVRILRRGQSLDTIDATRMKRDMNNKARGGLIKKNYMDEDDVYAGSAIFASPSPSSLPLPSFFNNSIKTKSVKNIDEFHHDSATRDLRRLLRLE